MADTTPDNPELTKLTVNLIPRSVRALHRSASRLAECEADTVNRALQLYDTLSTAEDGEAFVYDVRPGDQRTVVVYDAIPSLRWRRLYTHGVPVSLAVVAGMVLASLIWWGAS